ncbi:MAG: type II toxin-antitoxin system Phd/YefM family antitoxin [Candidatus Poribacteria bacterium]|nr:type II toxin-antitoxin system Phd/YefM family antitoxin [Candidatus Poribacteria bacterium]
MTEIGVNEAKTHLSSLLNRVENSESISITNKRKVVAVTMPPLDIMKKDANEAYSRFIGLITKIPLARLKR